MALTPPGPEDVLGRAARELRDEDQLGWIEISASIIDRVRTTTRRSWPVDAVFADPGGVGDSLQIADHVVRAAVATALQSRGDCRVQRLDLALDGHVCTGASVGVAVFYGVDIPALADDLVIRADTAFDDVLGPPTSMSTRSVIVHVSDVLTVDD